MNTFGIRTYSGARGGVAANRGGNPAEGHHDGAKLVDLDLGSFPDMSSLSFRRGNRTQRDEDTAATIAELKQGQDKLVELVQVSVRTASPLSCSPPTNPYTHPTQDLHVCSAKLFTLTSPTLEPEPPRRAAGDQGAAGAGRDDGCTIVMGAA